MALKVIDKIKKQLKWLTGYKVAIAMPNKTAYFQHRLGRAPLIWTESTNKLRGFGFGAVVYDELSTFSESELKKVEKLMAKAQPNDAKRLEK